jgi:retron-type reverse transcriptase
MLSGKLIDNNNSLFSLDVVSLFTNVPLDLAINAINDRWEHIEMNTKIPKNDFIEAIRFILTSTYFTFLDKTYKQTFGTPMGSPLSPIIADLVMQDLEDTAFKSLNTSCIFYFRYVDDIILATSDENLNLIVNFFNNYHDRLKFTVEREVNRSLSFLDLLIKIKNNMIHIDWYQKDTFSGRTLSFFSYHPLCHKIGIIYNLVDRCILLSHPQFFDKNLESIVST